MEKLIQNHKLKMHNPGFINYTYIVENVESKKGIIIDPSWEIDKLLRTITIHKIIPCAILLTHSHYDHTNLVNRIVNIYPDIKVYISKVEANYYNFTSKNLLYIEDEATLTINGFNIGCYLTPGHTKGSMIYHIDNNLYTGDTIFTEGCGICSGRGGSSKDMYYSVQFIKKLSGDNIIWPGHAFRYSPGYTLSHLFTENLYFLIEDKDLFIKFSDRRNINNAFNFI